VGDPSADELREVKVGFQFKFEGGKTIVGNVLAGTPAWRAGVSAGDELLALDGLRVDAMSIGARLQEKAPGSTASLTVFRRDELLTLPLAVESGPPTRLSLRPVDQPTPEQHAILEDWLREEPAATG
jgi:predicted metalloprotease with PDZ domain